MQEDLPLPQGFVRDFNASRDIEGLQDDYQSLARQLRRRGIDIEAIRRKVAAFSVALPTWGAGRGGTRFAKFPFDGAPTCIHENWRIARWCSNSAGLRRAYRPISPGISSRTMPRWPNGRRTSGWDLTLSTRTLFRTSS